jgi:hypothetical protein
MSLVGKFVFADDGDAFRTGHVVSLVDRERPCRSGLIGLKSRHHRTLD